MRKTTIMTNGLMLATAGPLCAVDIESITINNHDHAKKICPQVCARHGSDWNGNWRNISRGKSVCGCEKKAMTRTAPTTTPQVQTSSKTVTISTPNGKDVVPMAKLKGYIEMQIDAGYRLAKVSYSSTIGHDIVRLNKLDVYLENKMETTPNEQPTIELQK